MTINYHTHTARCGHAVGTDRAYVESAIKAGIKKLGFSDHSVQFFDGGFVSGIRMREQEAEGYITSIRALAAEYKNDIEILVGFEAEYFPSIFPRLQSFCRNNGVDYLLLGQHCLTTEPTKRWGTTPSDNEEELCRYVDEVLEGLATGSFSYLCHPDMFLFTGRQELYEKEMTRLCRGAKALNIPLEINLLGLRDHRHYPCDRFFAIAAREGNTFFYGSDAHSPDVFPDTVGKGMLKAFTKKHGITLLDDIILRKI